MTNYGGATNQHFSARTLSILTISILNTYCLNTQYALSQYSIRTVSILNTLCLNTQYALSQYYFMLSNHVILSEEVQTALLENKGVVALESTIIAHGMPYPRNVGTAFQ